MAGYLASLGIGLLLGLIGGGGSILTVPVLVYLFGISPLLATSYSLVIVGLVSLLGFISHYRRHLVSVRAGLLFGTASMLIVLFVRRFLLPQLPATLLSVKHRPVHSDVFLMIVFALLMIAAATAMLGNKQIPKDGPHPKKTSAFMILLYGAITGLITGFLGAGGGFLLIPALILFAGLPLKHAVGTSLMIISLNSLTGILADPDTAHYDWGFLAKLAALALAGLFAGLQLSNRLPEIQLKKIFGFFVLIMGVSILVIELTRF